MSNKIKRNFLIAARERGWFRAVSEQELTKAGKSPEEALHVEQPLEGANVLSAPDKYNLLHMGIAKSQGVKADLTAAVAVQVVERPDEITGLIRKLETAEEDFRGTNLKFEVENKLFDEQGEDKATELVDDPVYLKSLSVDSFDNSKLLADIIASRVTAESIKAVLADTTAQDKKKSVETLLGKLDGQDIIRWASSYGFYYGDGFNDYDGPARDEAKTYFDVPKSLMKNWKEAGKTPSGKPYDAIAAGENGRRVVFVTQGHVLKLKA